MKTKVTAILACVLSLFIWVGSGLPASAQGYETEVFVTTDWSSALREAKSKEDRGMELYIPYWSLDEFPKNLSEVQTIEFDLRGPLINPSLLPPVILSAEEAGLDTIYTVVAGKPPIGFRGCDEFNPNLVSAESYVGFYADQESVTNQTLDLLVQDYIIFVSDALNPSDKKDPFASNCLTVSGATGKLTLDFNEVQGGLSQDIGLDAEGKLTIENPSGENISIVIAKQK